MEQVIARVIAHFLSVWEHAGVTDGVLLTGSRSVGNEAENSDIDLQILVRDNTLRERGNQYVDGMLIEYFANPSARICGYLREEARQFNRSTIRMFATGIIVQDTSGMLSKAQALAGELLKSPFEKMSETELSAAKYSIWDCRDDLCALLASDDVSFPYVYYLNLNRILSLYSRYRGFELTSPSKQFAQMTDAIFRANYRIGEYPDPVFSELFQACITAASNAGKFNAISELVTYTLTAMGGFEIDGWRSRITP